MHACIYVRVGSCMQMRIDPADELTTSGELNGSAAHTALRQGWVALAIVFLVTRREADSISGSEPGCEGHLIGGEEGSDQVMCEAEAQVRSWLRSWVLLHGMESRSMQLAGITALAITRDMTLVNVTLGSIRNEAALHKHPPARVTKPPCLGAARLTSFPELLPK